MAAPIVREYLISPKVTDPAIRVFTQDHFVSVREDAVVKNKLFVYLPGSFRVPSESKGILRKATELGYHVIGLEYPNSDPVNPICKGTNDISCHLRARLQVIEGIHGHPDFHISKSNCILNRLKKLLIYLNKTYPSQNWGQFLVKGNIDWTKVVIAGHSQGGALAGVIGKFYPVQKVIMFSMIDYLNSGRIPNWETLPANDSKYLALINVKDELVPYARVPETWEHLGMTFYGGIINVDNSLPPYSSSHTLITSITPAVNLIDKYHNSTAVDEYIPKDASGHYALDKAWGYLLTK